MDNLIKNSNLAIDIGRKITNLLEMESLQSCRLANSSMKNMVDDPRFWLQKLDKKGLSKEHLIKWRKLINVVENTDLEENMTKCLMKMYQNFSKWAQAPIHIASKAGEASLVKIILEKIDSSMEAVSMDLYGAQHISDTLFFVSGGPIKNLHQKTAKMDQK